MTFKKDPKMHRNDLQFCDDPKKYPQNLHNPKNIQFSETTPKNIEIQNFEPKKK